MVCHETYKDKNGNWFILKKLKRLILKTIKKKDNSKVLVGPPESMSKSKKNTIDPEIMINQYGADAVDGLFYLIALPKKMYNGQIRVFHLLTNFYKKFGI